MKKKLLLLLLLCILAVFIFSLTVSAETYGDLTYSISNGEITITDCSASATVVVIPTKIDDYPVTSIASNAFSNCISLLGVDIPSTLTSIGDRAFYDCTSLVSVVNNSNLSFTIGNTTNGYVTYYAYKLVNKDGSITYKDGYFDDGNGFIFDGKNRLRAYVGRQSTITLPHEYKGSTYDIYKMKGVINITILGSMEVIGEDAFWDCRSLSSVTINRGVTVIDKYAFYGCDNLEYVFIPDTVNKIHVNAFSFCENLIEVTIPESVTSLISGAFAGCKNLKRVIFAGDSKLESVSSNCFDSCSSLMYINIPDTIKEISSAAFINCTSLKSITIPSSVRKIGDDAFRGCSSLENINIPEGVIDIGESAFYSCTRLERVTISSSVANIGEFAFAHCKSISEIKLDKGNEYYSSDENGAFYNKDKTSLIFYPGDAKLTSCYIPESVTSIAFSAFSSCSNLTEITLPFVGATLNGTRNTHFGYIFGASTYTYNEEYVPKSLEKATITGGTSIGRSAFYGCQELKKIILPSSLTSIGASAFFETGYYNNSSNWENGVLYIGDYLISASNTLSGEYTIKDGTVTIADEAMLECRSLRSVTVPRSVENIGSIALGYYRGGLYKVDGFSIYGYSNTIAEVYATNNKILFSPFASVSIEGTSFVLDGSIGLKMYFDITDVYESSTTVNSVVYDTEKNAVISESVLTPILDTEKELFYVITHIAPMDVDNVEVRNTVVCGSVTIEADSINVSDYISDFKEMAKTDEEFAKGLGVVEALETYSKYADSFFNGGEMGEIVADTDAIEKIAKPTKTGSISGIKHISTSLILEGNTTIRHYFEVTGGTYTFKVGEEELEATEFGDGIIYVDIADIPAQNLDEVYTLSVNDTFEISYSALNYVKSAVASNNVKLQKLAKALYNYWSAAEEYANQI